MERNSSTTSQEYCDSRLGLIDIGFWSGIQITNQLAATLLSLYLKTDHPTLGLFDYDLFLTDLVNQRVRYCSRLLVSSILSWACVSWENHNSNGPELIIFIQQTYCYFNTEIVSIGDAFFNEANNLWQLEHSSDSLPTIAAAQLLSLRSIYNGNGNGRSYLKVGIGMAQRMGLFGLAEVDAATKSKENPDSWDRASSHTAWGAFNWAAYEPH